MTKFMNYVLNKMLFETCGEDPDVIENVKITELSDYYYHIQYDEKNPYNGIDFKVEVQLEEDQDTIQHRYIAHFYIEQSVYGDNGAFEIEL